MILPREFGVKELHPQNKVHSLFLKAASQSGKEFAYSNFLL
jgi:hypothetical protein